MNSVLDLKNEIIKNHNYVVLLRRYFHTFPEVSLEEVNTASKIELELDNLLIEHYRINNNVIGIINNHLDTKVLLRSDIDALRIEEETNLDFKSANQGVMHACGHDFHIASLLGVAKVLQAHKDELNVKVILVFQSAEENGQGGKQVISTNILEGVSSCVGIHVCPELKSNQIGLISGPLRASVDYFKIVVTGKSSHIANPSRGIDACYVASKIVAKAKELNNLEGDYIDRVLVGIGRISSGTAYNIIAEKAEIEGTIRAFSQEKREKTINTLKSLANDIANEVGATINILVNDNTCPIVNDQNVCDELINDAKLAFNNEQIITSMEPELIGDDFGEYNTRVPGVYVLIGTHDEKDECTGLPLHNCRFTTSEDALINSVLLLCLFVLHYKN